MISEASYEISFQSTMESVLFKIKEIAYVFHFLSFSTAVNIHHFVATYHLYHKHESLIMRC